MVALRRLRAAILTACLRFTALKTSRRFFSLFCTWLSKLPGCLASSNSGTSESRDVQGLRPNWSSNAVILEGSDESGRVRLIQHAGATFSFQRSG